MPRFTSDEEEHNRRNPDEEVREFQEKDFDGATQRLIRELSVNDMDYEQAIAFFGKRDKDPENFALRVSVKTILQLLKAHRSRDKADVIFKPEGLARTSRDITLIAEGMALLADLKGITAKEFGQLFQRLIGEVSRSDIRALIESEASENPESSSTDPEPSSG
jgi:hypothetical protein